MTRSSSMVNLDGKFAAQDFRAFVFDWDGVLVDSSRNYYRAYELVLKEVGITTTPREIYLREGQPTPDLIATLCRERGIAVTKERVMELVRRRREYDIAIGPRRFFPAMLAVLDRLREGGKKIAMVTGSSRKSVDLVLQKDQERRFDVIITADDVSRPKPDPQPFAMAAELLAVSPQESLVIENAPYGIRSAKAAGCRVVAICTTLNREDLAAADWTVKNHQELEELLVVG